MRAGPARQRELRFCSQGRGGGNLRVGCWSASVMARLEEWPSRVQTQTEFGLQAACKQRATPWSGPLLFLSPPRGKQSRRTVGHALSCITLKFILKSCLAGCPSQQRSITLYIRGSRIERGQSARSGSSGPLKGGMECEVETGLPDRKQDVCSLDSWSGCAACGSFLKDP